MRKILWYLVISFCYFTVSGFAQELSYGVIEGYLSTEEVSPRVTVTPSVFVADPTFTFNSFVRWPSEDGDLSDPWYAITMKNGNTAYFRDVLIGARVYLRATAGVSSESWNTVFTAEDGTIYNFSPVTYYANYSGYQNCFVTSGWYCCGKTSIGIVWYLTRDIARGQCLPSTKWQADFTHNGTQVYSSTFDLLPQIESERIPFLSQNGNTSAYDNICRRTGMRDVFPCPPDPLPVGIEHWTIAGKGCAITSAAMVLGYHGVSVDPSTLNNWLINHNGYDAKGKLYWDKIAGYGNTHGGTISYLGGRGDLFKSTCTYGPHVVHMFGRNHWLTSYGKDRPLTNWLVKDPDGGRISQLGTVTDSRFYAGQQFTFTDALNGISFRFYSPVEAFVIDPQGRRYGYDPKTDTNYSEIPTASYNSLGQDDDETGEPEDDMGMELEVMAPSEGDYVFVVTGTATETYDAEMRVFRQATQYDSGIKKQAIPTAPGVVHAYKIRYSDTSTEPITLGGNFNGGGQRPVDVNRLLSYASPGENHTALPVGTSTYPMTIFYDSVILPETFTATIEGTDVSSLFHPSQGIGETVNIPVGVGRNTIILSVQGKFTTKTATDTDRLVFLVQ
ncbi:MAG: C39 family peptidase [Smithella sp.]|jgi:hypothetical protein